MNFIINNIRLGLDAGNEELEKHALKKLGIKKHQLSSIKTIKESVDARRKSNISIVYSVLVEVKGKLNISPDDSVKQLEEAVEEQIISGDKLLNSRPIVIGTGPAGLFAGLVLAQNGFNPLVLERGEDVENRSKTVDESWRTGRVNTESNVQFGEGGAGTFSDGKLTTRINDRRCEKVLRELYEAGAHEEILYRSKPHVGTDVLKKVVVNMRNRIIELGGEVRFGAKVTSLNIKNGVLKNVVVNGNEEIASEVVVLAIGHSARDTFKAIYDNGVKFIQKPFSIGVRIEHLQSMINESQYGEAANHPKLSTADYQLFNKTGERTAYSFCMCPGGIVVASASEENTIVTNGMSEYARDRENANSALVVSVGPGDFGGDHPLQGIEFQRIWERAAFNIAGNNNSAPVQRLEDFMEGKVSKGFGVVKPSYTGEVTFADLNKCLPDFVTDNMKKSIGFFDNKLKGFGMKDALLTGVETRTSSPVRIPRGDTLEAEGVVGLYPAGEGAGYAGGIVSAAVDGIRIAEQIIKIYRVK